MPEYKISSFNVNGIRAAERKGFSDWVKKEQPDIICLQEIKADENQVPESITELGYHAAWHSAEKKGYAGVAILSRIKPEKILRGMQIDWIDSEGRVLMFEFPEFRVFSVYFPSGTTGDIRQEVKYRFMDAFKLFSADLAADARPVLFCGDVNIAHTEIDIHDPVRNKKTSGFLPEERQWFSGFLESGYEDVFRNLHPGKPDLYSWWTYRANAKANNKGWRLDYHLATPEMAAKAKSAVIERELNLSDHVPVTVVYKFP